MSIIKHLDYCSIDYVLYCDDFLSLRKTNDIDLYIQEVHYILDIDKFDDVLSNSLLVPELLYTLENDRIYNFYIDIYVNRENFIRLNEVLNWTTTNKIHVNILFNDFYRGVYYDNSDRLVTQPNLIDKDVSTQLFMDSIIHKYMINDKEHLLNRY